MAEVSFYTMCHKDRRILNKCRPQLIENLQVDETFLSYLRQKGVIKNHDHERLRAIAVNQDRAAHLLDYVEKGGPFAFAFLVYALSLTQRHLAEMLDEELVKKWAEVEDEDAEKTLLKQLLWKNVASDQENTTDAYENIMREMTTMISVNEGNSTHVYEDIILKDMTTTVRMNEENNDSPPDSRPDPKIPHDSRPDPKTPQDSRPDPKTPQDSRPDPKTPQDSRPDPKTSQDSRPDPKTPQDSRPDPKTPQDSRPNTKLIKLIRDLRDCLQQSSSSLQLETKKSKICSAIQSELLAIYSDMSTISKSRRLEYACHYSDELNQLLPLAVQSGELISASWQTVQKPLSIHHYCKFFLHEGIVQYSVDALEKDPNNINVLMVLLHIAHKSPHYLTVVNCLHILTKLLTSSVQETSFLSCRILATVLISPKVCLPKQMKSDLTTRMWKAIESWDLQCVMENVDDIGMDYFSEMFRAHDHTLKYLSVWTMMYCIGRNSIKYIPLLQKEVGSENLMRLSKEKFVDKTFKILLEQMAVQLESS